MGGRIQCTVTGKQRYSADLKQGGLEILVPASVLFKAKAEEILKLKRVFKNINH